MWNRTRRWRPERNFSPSGAKHLVQAFPGALAQLLLTRGAGGRPNVPRPLRMLNPSEIFFVTVRCFQGRYLLRPSTETNQVLGGVLSRAVRLHGVELFSFSVISSHLHLVLRAPRGNLPGFMQYLLTNVSKK